MHSDLPSSEWGQEGKLGCLMSRGPKGEGQEGTKAANPQLRPPSYPVSAAIRLIMAAEVAELEGATQAAMGANLSHS